MWNYTKSYLKFCWHVLKEELPHTKGYKPMTKAWRVFWYLVGAVGIFTILGYLYPVVIKHPYISGGLFLSLVIVTLLILIGFIKGFHERTVNELTRDFETRAETIERLSELQGRGFQLMLDFTMDEVPARTLRIWAEQIDKALYRCYGLSGKDKFEGGRGYTLEVPEEGYKQSGWLHATVYRIEDLIKEELPPPEKIDTSNLPDEAFMT